MRPGGAVWLVGMMGAGKSAVGAALAERLALPFVDVDAMVEDRAGHAIAEIFASQGEAAFRAQERECIREAARTPAVVALGGGAIAQLDMAGWLAARGTVVYLKAGLETLLERVGEAAERPLLRGLDRDERRRRLESLLAERASAYESARIVVETDHKSVDEAAEAVACALEALP